MSDESAKPERRAVPNERLVHAIDMILRASTMSQTRQLRRTAPLFDQLFRVRTACGGQGSLHQRLLALYGTERTRDTELLSVGLAVRLLRTTDLLVDDVIETVAYMIDQPPLYATCCVVIALIRLEYTAQLEVFLNSPAGLAYKSEQENADARGVLFSQTKRPFAAAAVLVALESGAFVTADALVRQQWFGERISLVDLRSIEDKLARLVHTIMARAENEPRAVPLFVSDEQVVRALGGLAINDNLRQLLPQLSAWQHQSMRQLGAAEQAQIVQNQHRFQLNRLIKLSQTAGLVHVSVAQELCTDAESDDAPIGSTSATTSVDLARQFRQNLEERTQVCARLEEGAPTNVNQAKVQERRPHVLAALEDAIYNYRILLAVERSGHEQALTAEEIDAAATHDREAIRSLKSIIALVDAAGETE